MTSITFLIAALKYTLMLHLDVFFSSFASKVKPSTRMVSLFHEIGFRIILSSGKN